MDAEGVGGRGEHQRYVPQRTRKRPPHARGRGRPSPLRRPWRYSELPPQGGRERKAQGAVESSYPWNSPRLPRRKGGRCGFGVTFWPIGIWWWPDEHGPGPPSTVSTRSRRKIGVSCTIGSRSRRFHEFREAACRLKDDPAVHQLARDLGLSRRGDPLTSIRGFALDRVRQILTDSPVAVTDLESLRLVLADKFRLRIEFLSEDSDIERVCSQHADFHPLLAPRLREEFLKGETEGIMLERSGWDPTRFGFLAGDRRPRESCLACLLYCLSRDHAPDHSSRTDGVSGIPTYPGH